MEKGLGSLFNFYFCRYGLTKHVVPVQAAYLISTFVDVGPASDNRNVQAAYLISTFVDVSNPRLVSDVQAAYLISTFVD